MLIGDFNLIIDNKNLEIFMNTFSLECLINKPTYSKTENPSCIDLILANTKEHSEIIQVGKNIQKEDTKEHSEIIQVGISEHHSLVATSLKSQLVRQMKIGLPIKSKGISM